MSISLDSDATSLHKLVDQTENDQLQDTGSSDLFAVGVLIGSGRAKLKKKKGMLCQFDGTEKSFWTWKLNDPQDSYVPAAILPPAA